MSQQTNLNGVFLRKENGEIVLSDRIEQPEINSQLDTDNLSQALPRLLPVRELDVFNSFLGQFCNQQAKALMKDPNDPSIKEGDKNELDGECDLIFNSNESIGDENEPHSTSNGGEMKRTDNQP